MAGSDYSSNPYRVGGLPSTNSLNRMGGFTRVSPQTFALAGMGSALQRRSPFRMPSNPMANLFGDENPDDADVLGYGKPERSGGKIDSLKNFLTGQGGAAVGGIAQGAGNVIGAYLQRKQEQERLKEEKRRAMLEEENNARVQALLMPLLQSEMERAKRYQEQVERDRQQRIG